MLSLRTIKELSAARKRLGFCYLCGKVFNAQDEINRDHVPPESVFAAADRVSPLIFKTHASCNAANSIHDELIGQFLSVMHGRFPREKDVRLTITNLPEEVAPASLLGVHHLPWIAIIRRWVQGFHAALYGEYVSVNDGLVYSPMLELPRDEREHRIIEINQRARPTLTRMLKEQLRVGNIDSIECNEGKCVYRCTWVHDDNGNPWCLFALRVYNWEELCDHPDGKKRGCVGFYPTAIPSNGARAAVAPIDFEDLEPLDPFAQ